MFTGPPDATQLKLFEVIEQPIVPAPVTPLGFTTLGSP